MKRRSCRRTKDQNWYHDKAVKMRKMTDEQLVNYVEERVEKARSEGFNEGKGSHVETATAAGLSAADFLEELKTRKVPGIGTITIKKLEGVAREYGYV